MAEDEFTEMQDDIVYSEVVFIKREEPQSKAAGAEGSVVDAEVKIPRSDNRKHQHKRNKAKSDTACLRCALLGLMVLCVVLLGAVAALILLRLTQEGNLKGFLQGKNMKTENITALRQHEHYEIKSNCYKACPTDWEFHGGKCYFFSENALSWTQSRDCCVSSGGHLVIINNKEEQEFLTESFQLKMRDESDKFWIGLTEDLNETQWLWVDNTPLDVKQRYWIGNKADNFTEKSPAGEDCACIGKNYMKQFPSNSWYDDDCATSYKRICEIKSPMPE